MRLAGLTAAKHFIEHMGRLNAAGSQKLSEVVGEIPIAWPSSQLSSPQLTWVAAFLPGMPPLPSSIPLQNNMVVVVQLYIKHSRICDYSLHVVYEM